VKIAVNGYQLNLNSIPVQIGSFVVTKYYGRDTFKYADMG